MWRGNSNWSALLCDEKRSHNLLALELHWSESSDTESTTECRRQIPQQADIKATNSFVHFRLSFWWHWAFDDIISFSYEKKDRLNEITRATNCWIRLEEELQYVVSQPEFTHFCWRAGQNKFLTLYLKHRGTKEKYSLTLKLRKVSWANSNHFHPS